MCIASPILVTGSVNGSQNVYCVSDYIAKDCDTCIQVFGQSPHDPYKQMKSSQNIQRLGHTKFTSCSSDFVLKTLERASDLKMLISFPFFVCLSSLMSET
jgi:hypothetical protein